MAEREVLRVRGRSVRDVGFDDPRMLSSARVRLRGHGKARLLFPKVEPGPNAPQLIRLRRYPYGLFPDRPTRSTSREAYARTLPQGPLSLRDVLSGREIGERR